MAPFESGGVCDEMAYISVNMYKAVCDCIEKRCLIKLGIHNEKGTILCCEIFMYV